MSTETEAITAAIREAVNEALQPLLERDDRPLLSVPQAAARLGISVKGAWNLIRAEQLPSVMIGENRRMVEPAAVDHYIARRRG